jgi:predicted phage terminase large subunit-like protein
MDLGNIPKSELLRRVGLLPVDEQDEILALLRELEEKEKQEGAQTGFMNFVKAVWPTFIEGNHHLIMADAFERLERGEIKRLAISMPPRHCLAVDTPIPTPAGWKTMGELRVGDFVFGADGVPTMIVGKSQVHHGRKCYRVTTSDGARVVCDEGHLWSVAVCRKRPDVFKNKTAGELAARETDRRPWTPDSPAVVRAEKDLPVDPYMLGLWLGDGHRHQAIITSGDDDRGEVRRHVEAAGYVTTDQSARCTFGVLDLKVKLREIGVLGDKHIPADYLMASISQRWALVDGLMDSDGNVSKAGQCFLATSSPVLRDQYRELLWSLGVKNGLSTSRAVFNGRDYGEAYRIGFYAADVGRLERKRERAKGHRKPVRRYLSFEEVESVPVQCIEVAADDGLFLCGEGHIVTHNTKSEFASYLFPAWLMGKDPTRYVIMASHTGELATGFGRKVKNLIGEREYNEIFPGVAISPDSKASGRWNTNKNGAYYAIGVGGNIAGRGADFFIIDDPMSEQDAIAAETNPGLLDDIYDWYTSGPIQRLQPGGRIVIVMTRWHKRDLVGRVLKAQEDRVGGEPWEYIELPAILPSGKSLWPEYWSIEEMESRRDEMPVAKWLGQYMQTPTSQEGAILKREWWRRWPSSAPPEFNYVIQSWDTAYTKSTRADYSACTTWGVFDWEDPENGKISPHLFLIDAIRGRMEFPELKTMARELYNRHSPDTLLIESQAAGAPLIHELRAMGMPVAEFRPTRKKGVYATGTDKIARANAVSSIFESKFVWAPETRWAEEVIEECGEFPFGEHDDYVDSTVMSLLRFRMGGFIGTSQDEDDEDDEPEERRKYGYQI